MAKKPAIGDFGFSTGETSFGIYQYGLVKNDVKPGISFVRVRGTVNEESIKTVTEAVALLNKGKLTRDSFTTKTISPASLAVIVSAAKKKK